MRNLTERQHDRLALLATTSEDCEDETVVVGWYNNGPLVRFPNTLVRVVTPDGRLRAVPRAVTA